MKKQRNVTSLAKGQRNSAMIERRAKGTVDRCICVHTSCFKRAGCEMRLPGLLAGRVYGAWTRGVMKWLCCRSRGD